MRYAVLFNTESEDLSGKPECLLFEADTDEDARFTAAKAFFDHMDCRYFRAAKSVLLYAIYGPPRIVRLHDIGAIEDNAVAKRALKELDDELKVRQDEHQKKKEREDEEYERKTYERLKAKYESEPAKEQP